MAEEVYVHLMRRAVELARRGCFKTFPNPMVGAVLARDGRILAEGWHHAAGQPHAEIDCLENARKNGIDPAGCTLAVTLEPCRHHGKTPPCADAVREAGITTLVYGAGDPNPEAAGGAELLAAAGLEVVGPVLERECLDLIADFTVWQTTDRPYVFLKLAATLDGRIATRNGNSQWISNPASRGRVQKLRQGIGACHGAVLIGGGTFRGDNPRLSVHDGGEPQPLACIITSRLPKPDADFHLLRERASETIFFASPAAAASTTAEALRKLGCRVLAMGPGEGGGLDFGALFHIIRQDLGCPYVLCEGGGRLAMALLENGCVDEFHLHLAPMILGDEEARPLFRGREPLSLEEALRMRFCCTNLCEGDAHLLLRPLAG